MNGSEFRDRLLSRVMRARLTVTAQEIDQLAAYYRLLTRWNRTINLTALPLDPVSDATLDRLLIEPLAASVHVSSSSASPSGWFDLGSGGGSPAIPLKIVRPSLKLTMIEARQRKAAFLREVARDLGIPDSAVVDDRFEALQDRSDFMGVASLVTVRAVRIDSGLLTISRQLLSSLGGRLFVFGGDQAPPTGFPMFGRVDTVELPVGNGSKLLIAVA